MVTIPATPHATYRLQLTPSFGFDAARRVLPYLRRLGISHVYLSPCLQAVEGSEHGYDVADPTAIDRARGGEEAFERLLGAAREQGLGVVLDIVPNHVAASEQNPWWRDVLEHGRESRFAGHFDIDWEPAEPELRGKVLLPILGDTPEKEIEAGHVTVHTRGDGTPELGVYERRLPLSPESIAKWLHEESMETLLDAQHYRLEFWRRGLECVNWRRFFDVTELIGVRVEREEVFLDTHGRILDLVHRGLVQGLRVDHPDGLLDPAGYLARLREAAPHAWIVVEKILEPGERLPSPWPVDGTTGYDFLVTVDGLFVEPGSETPLTATCMAVVGSCPRFAELRRDKKRFVVRELFVAETNRIVHLAREALAAVGGPDDEAEVRRAVEALLVEMPVYRTYVVEGRPADARDRHWLAEAFEQARAQEPSLDADVLGGLHTLLTGESVAGRQGARLRARFQQLSGPVMAKGLEDTAFYCDRRLVCLDEVGADPSHFGVSPAEFHAWCADRAARWPRTMVTTSTHDTKRSADVRLRIATLTEVPVIWDGEVREWSELAKRHRRHAERPLRGAEYLLWQTLVGAWPVSVERVTAYMQKAAREAKLRTSWLDPNPAYEDELERFVAAVMGDRELTERVGAFVERILPAARVHSLAETMLLLTAVGVPDVYQGCELWRESLTDPDNRRAVDFDALTATLDRVAELGPEEALADGEPKAWLVHCVLRYRRDHPEAFGEDAGYEPLEVEGPDARRIVAFTRGGRIAVVVPRLVTSTAIASLDCRVELPAGRWRDVLSGEDVSPEATATELLARFPVALLERV